ncbi:hypothetical protein F5X96DRAFT_629727 [Biscogniauxia mediterranea]|nr:hypothetical protein F5X96DRAFT_629727 [Biscogniauxia mediterranea]
MANDDFTMKRRGTGPGGIRQDSDKPKPSGPVSKAETKSPLETFLDMAAKTDFGDSKSTALLEKYRAREPDLQDKFLHKLAYWHNLKEDVGNQLLRWIIKTHLRKYFDKPLKAASIGVNSPHNQLTPLQLAIDKRNHSFLNCFLNICKDSKSDVGDARKLLQLKPSEKEKGQDNCIHRAIREKLPCVRKMVALCNPDALTDENSDGDTPLHLAMMRSNGGTAVAETQVPKNTVANTSKSRIDSQGLEFSASGIIDELMIRDPRGNLIASLLVKTNKEGLSPYQVRLQTFDTAHDTTHKGQGDMSFQEQEKAAERDFQSRLKAIIFSKISLITDVSRALYGTRGFEKELSLDMSDFNSSSHDFKLFIDKLINLDDDPSTSLDGMAEYNRSLSGSNPVSSHSLSFESCLFFVYLPDLNNFRKPCPHEGVRELFDWLRDVKRVQRIKTLSIPDSTTSPMSDEFVHEAIVKSLRIEKFDWHKLDLNLEILTRSDYPEEFTELTLYSSGNWSVLYQWTSDDGLPKLASLKKVTIKIVSLNPSDGIHDKRAHELHASRVQEYKKRLLDEHTARKQTAMRARKLRKEDKIGNGDQNGSTSPNTSQRRATDNPPKLNYEYELEVIENARWSFPVLKYSGSDEPFVPRLQFLDQLLDTYKLLDNFDPNEDCGRRFRELTSIPEANERDRRIKVAIIDNGVDRIRANVKDMIAKGISFVSADQQNGHRILPWWMVADPHGTQMASLVGQANNYCRLYIARVGKGRKDILPEHAAEAIKWCLEQNVDVISISWVIKTPDDVLKTAISKAVKDAGRSRRTLVFCSTADEGVYSGSVYPANYEGLDVVSVAATDPYGNLRPPSDGRVNILVPGEDIEADGPSYMSKNVSRTVSGSSVATALAAGIASLALLMLQTFNDSSEGDNEEKLKEFYTKEGIMKVFKKMNSGSTGVQLANLFPNGVNSDWRKLEEKWRLSNFV